MYIWFEGMGGTAGCWRGVRGEAPWVGGGCGRVEASGVSRPGLGEPGWGVGSGGGKGDMDRAVTEAEGCAL